jgi:hypothetical protein
MFFDSPTFLHWPTSSADQLWCLPRTAYRTHRFQLISKASIFLFSLSPKAPIPRPFLSLTSAETVTEAPITSFRWFARAGAAAPLLASGCR